MNTDKKRKFISPAARKNLLEIDSILFKDALPPAGGLNQPVFIPEIRVLKENGKIRTQSFLCFVKFRIVSWLKNLRFFSLIVPLKRNIIRVSN